MPRVSDLIDVDDEIVPELEALSEEMRILINLDRTVLDSYIIPVGFTLRVLSVDFDRGCAAARVKMNEEQRTGKAAVDKLFDHNYVWIPVGYEEGTPATEKYTAPLCSNFVPEGGAVEQNIDFDELAAALPAAPDAGPAVAGKSDKSTQT